jgi:GNAT superfamily N-acetyltransferase
MADVNITMWSPEMLDPVQLKPSAAPAEALELRRGEIPSRSWYWLDRLQWSYAEWERYVGRAALETWVGYVRGTPAGYFELERQHDGVAVEIAQLGLLPQFIGQGLGGHLLTLAVLRAWAIGPRRVWVRTFSLDGPHALDNYAARGFRVFDTRTGAATVPDHPPGPWPGAR